MASTHGRARLPLPPSLVAGLESLGFVEYPDQGDATPAGTHRYRLPRHPGLSVSVVASNLPGESTVIAHRPGEVAVRIEVDALLVDLAVDMALLDQGVRK